MKAFQLVKHCFLLLFVSTLPCTSQPTLGPDVSNSEMPQSGIRAGTCRFAPGLTVGDEASVLECCNQTVSNYTLQWSLGRAYLTNYLQSLSWWNCPQFEDECRNRFYEVNDFTRLVYDYFCDYENYVGECIKVVDAINAERMKFEQEPEEDEQTNNTQIVMWRAIVSRIDSAALTLDELVMPCMQVALYEAEGEHFGGYHEVIRLNLPSCSPTWCGFDGKTLRSRIITAWTCMSNSCRSKIVVIMVVCGLLAILVTVVNLSVILVYFYNPAMLHSQGVYKVSLALADILVGIVVFPTFVSSLTRFTSGRHLHAGFVDVTGYATNESGNTTIVQVREVGGRFSDFFDQSYLNAVGFFTVLSLSVSVYSLTVAGFDRMSAVYRPLSYRKDLAKKLAKKVCIALWGVGIFFAISPTFIPGLRYALVASILVSSGGQNALILYIVAFAIPLILMWVVNGATFHWTKKHARARRHLTIDSKKKTVSIEIRLARTLSIMVGVFTMSILPAALVILGSLFARSIYYSNPRELDLQSATVYSAFEFVSILILACNSLWNFFIYSARNFEFRKALSVIISKSGMNKCCVRLVSRAQSMVHDGRKRFSSIPTISSGFGKKSSVAQTSTTGLNSKIKSSDFTTADESTQSKHSRSTGAVLSTTKVGEFDSSSRFDSTSRDSSTSSLTSIAKQSKDGKKKKMKHREVKSSENATDDSVFQSFAIDANADRLYLSVMEKIDEEIIELRDKDSDATRTKGK